MVLVVVALVVPILLLARRSGSGRRDRRVARQSVENTAGLAGLRTTIESAGSSSQASTAAGRGWRSSHDGALTSDTQETAWWIAVIAGFVVVLAVAALLSLLGASWCGSSTGGSRGAETLLQRRAANTTNTTLIPQTADSVDAVLAEGLRAPSVLGPSARKGAAVTTLVVLTVVDIVLLIAGLALVSVRVGSPADPDRRQPRGVQRRTSAASSRHAELISPGVTHINRTGGVVAGALPLLYGMAEGIVVGVTYVPDPSARPPAAPASGRRRSRLHETVGYEPVG